MYKNNRKSMTILGKKVVSLQSEKQKNASITEKNITIINKKQNNYESNDYQRRRQPRSGEP